jgi:hypothetical protein
VPQRVSAAPLFPDDVEIDLEADGAYANIIRLGASGG